ncbi:MAG: hypothetical protein R2879_05365 [Saprospiraceae bacterium]
MIIYQNQLLGVIGFDGKVLVPPIYEKITYAYPFFLLEKGGRTKILTLENQIISNNIPAETNFEFYDDEVVCLTKNDSYFILDHNAKLIAQFKQKVERLPVNNPLAKGYLKLVESNERPVYVSKDNGRVFKE